MSLNTESSNISRPSFVARLDVDLRFRRVESATEEFLGFPVHDFAGLNFPKLLEQQLDTATFEEIRPTLSKAQRGQTVSFEFRDSQHRYQQALLMPDRPEHGINVGYVLFTFDLSAQRRREQRDAFLLMLEDKLRASSDPDAITGEALRLLAEFLDVQQCYYLEFAEDCIHFRVKVVFDNGSLSSPDAPSSLNDFHPDLKLSVCGGKNVVVQRADLDLHGGADLAARGIQALVAVQLSKEGRVIGSLIVCQATPRDWQPHEVELVEATAHRCWESLERARAIRQLSLSKDRLHLAQRAGRSGSFDWLIPEDRIIWSPELEALYGLEEGTFEGSIGQWEKRVLPEDAARVLRGLQKCLQERLPNYDYEFRAVLPDGRLRWLRGQAMFVYTEDGSPLRMVGINIDIEQQKQSEESLRQMNRDLEQFAFSASHDLQEPIRNISVYAEMLKRRYQDRLDKEGREFLGFIHAGAQRMILLIQDLLAYTRTTGEMEAPSTMVSASSVMAELAEQLASAITECGAELTWEDLPSLPVHASHLTQVLQNLVSNALKYRGVKQPVVRVTAEPVGAYWQFAVADNGIGIDQQYQDKIFGMFKRLHRESEYPGTGIGLAICHRLVTRYGGNIWVCSEVGQGSTFYFTLPVSAESIPLSSTPE